MTIALRCRCGKLRGQVDTARVAARAVCYCKDCQAFGHFLGPGALDAAGGTEVAATLPAAVRFDAGLEHLACMSLSPKGLYRWYASCCRTPVGTTPRDRRTSYVGVIRACLDASPEEMDRLLGPLGAHVNTKSATRPVKPGGIATVGVVARVGLMLLKARLGGGYRDNPFFQPGASAPLREPRMLTREERAALTR